MMRRPQFSLRSLFILTAVVAILLWAWKPLLFVLVAGIGGAIAVLLLLSPIIALAWLMVWIQDGRKYRQSNVAHARLPATPPTE